VHPLGTQAAPACEGVDRRPSVVRVRAQDAVWQRQHIHKRLTQRVRAASLGVRPTARRLLIGSPSFRPRGRDEHSSAGATWRVVMPCSSRLPVFLAAAVLTARPRAVTLPAVPRLDVTTLARPTRPQPVLLAGSELGGRVLAASEFAERHCAWMLAHLSSIVNDSVTGGRFPRSASMALRARLMSAHLRDQQARSRA
jgi:hypothetical protein